MNFLKFTTFAVLVTLAATASGGVEAAPKNSKFTAYLTGYSFWDNTPPGSAAIAKPVIHKSAGGIGTFRDPVTIAVGHTRKGFRRTMDFPAGTKFYLPKLRKYAIVEDLCGDGPRPQDGACHIGHKGYPWIDIYVGGRSVGVSASDQCMRRITGLQEVIINPHKSYAVVPGEISENCRTY
jgi:hypothetical protein